MFREAMQLVYQETRRAARYWTCAPSINPNPVFKENAGLKSRGDGK